jgi:HPt (histidine-containing phosphotransfer) domain-containing protein
MGQAMTDIAERLHGQLASDHAWGCMGRQYNCDCGYDADTEKWLAEAAAEIERLRAENEQLRRALDVVPGKPTEKDIEWARAHTGAQAMSAIAARLHGQLASDHVRGCMGRQYSCDCGYDAETEKCLAEAAAEIEQMQAKIERWQAQSIAQYAEIKRLREQVDALRLVATSHEPEALRLRAEIERLKAENEELFANNGDAANLLGKAEADNERLRAVVLAIDESDPEKPSSWRYRREELCAMARAAQEPKP